MVHGKSIKSRLTTIKKALVNDEISDSNTEISIHLESEFSERNG